MVIMSAWERPKRSEPTLQLPQPSQGMNRQVPQASARGDQDRVDGAALRPQTIQQKVIGRGAGINPIHRRQRVQPKHRLRFQKNSGRKGGIGFVMGRLERERACAGQEGAAQGDGAAAALEGQRDQSAAVKRYLHDRSKINLVTGGAGQGRARADLPTAGLATQEVFNPGLDFSPRVQRDISQRPLFRQAALLAP